MAEDRAERDEEAEAADRLEAVLAAVEAGNAEALSMLLEPLHAADIADILEQIGPSERQALLALWQGGIDGDILSEIDDSIREEVIEALPDEVVAEAVRELDTDDVVDISKTWRPRRRNASSTRWRMPTGWRWNRRCPTPSIPPAA